MFVRLHLVIGAALGLAVSSAALAQPSAATTPTSVPSAVEPLPPCDTQPGKSEFARPVVRKLGSVQLASCVSSRPAYALCDNLGSVTDKCENRSGQTEPNYELRLTHDGRVDIVAGPSSIWTRWPRATLSKHGDYTVVLSSDASDYYGSSWNDHYIIVSARGVVFHKMTRECGDSGSGKECRQSYRVRWLGRDTVQVTSPGDKPVVIDLRTAPLADSREL